ncbi:hypothetical protein HHK36_006090 [Tetracentron sinense]|uniref:Uncharacterized protein n=1 Tax=Tetracentron sinense TaxID=13715 RepID=A0A835DNX1_TETSI|nr:hypothetical protein HHK36_006090 [Tetracentron sinense]
MPKDRRDRSLSFDRCRASPFPCSSSRARRSSSKNPSEPVEDLKEWEEARCPVCMEHPHNAVLLLCSSHEKGCRPYMCDTSYRHSNCLDQFRKSSVETPSTIPLQEETSLSSTASHVMTPETIGMDIQEEEGREEGVPPGPTMPCESQVQPKLVCPLCRGHIDGWVALEPARLFMNAKARSCARETCDFSGTYADLRKHARLEHPLIRPSEADPERQRDWRRLERQRDIGDVLSTIQSAFGEERSDDSILSVDEGGLLTVFFLIRVFRPGASPSSNWSSTSRTRGRTRGQLSNRRRSTRLWGESYNRETGSSAREGDNESSESVSGSWRRREQRRRQTTPDNEPRQQ